MNKSRKKSIRRTFISGDGVGGCQVQFMLLLFCLVLAKCDKTIQNEIDSGSQTHTKNSFTELTGGSIVGEKWLRQAESPYTLQTDLHIERTGRLYIEPGVKVHVAPMVGITVRGILNALVSFIFNIFYLYFACPLKIEIFNCSSFWSITMRWWILDTQYNAKTENRTQR